MSDLREFDPYLPCIYIGRMPVQMKRGTDGTWIPTKQQEVPTREQEVRWKNGDVIETRKLVCILSSTPQTKNRLVEQCGLTPKTVTRLLSLLKSKGKVASKPATGGSIGRAKFLWFIP